MKEILHFRLNGIDYIIFSPEVHGQPWMLRIGDVEIYGPLMQIEEIFIHDRYWARTEERVGSMPTPFNNCVESIKGGSRP